MSAALAPAPLPDFVLPFDGGVHAIDTGFHRPRFDAAWLVVQDGRAAFVDTGTNFGVPRLLAALDALGIARDAVDWVIPTHVHLDHAGGVGALMAALPAARCLVHPRGARHLVDPSALWAGATDVYGAEEMARSYGEAVPVAADRVLATEDGGAVELAGRRLEFAHTPGHAKHHHCIWDEATRGWFTGDTFGLSYPEFDTAKGPWLLPTSTPVQFEPDVLEASVQRLLARDPRWVYLTHFGRIGDVGRVGAQGLELLRRTVALALELRTAPDRRARLEDGLRRLYREGLAAHGCTRPVAEVDALLALDVDLNAEGIEVWLDRESPRS